MTGADVLIDTNAVIAWLKQDSEFAKTSLAWSNPAISIFTLGELYFGAAKSAKPEENRDRVRSVRSAFGLLSPTERTAELYSSARHQLRTKGRPIPEHDIWIAAIALEHKIPLVTKDRHFNEVQDLVVVGW